MNRFLYDRNLRHERVKIVRNFANIKQIALGEIPQLSFLIFKGLHLHNIGQINRYPGQETWLIFLNSAKPTLKSNFNKVLFSLKNQEIYVKV